MKCQRKTTNNKILFIWGTLLKNESNKISQRIGWWLPDLGRGTGKWVKVIKMYKRPAIKYHGDVMSSTVTVVINTMLYISTLLRE